MKARLNQLSNECRSHALVGSLGDVGVALPGQAPDRTQVAAEVGRCLVLMGSAVPVVVQGAGVHVTRLSSAHHPRAERSLRRPEREQQGERVDHRPQTDTEHAQCLEPDGFHGQGAPARVTGL